MAERIERALDLGGIPRDVALLVVSATALAASLVWPDIAGINPAWVAIVLCGGPIMCGAAVALVVRHDVKADLLVSIALVASIVIGEYFAAGEVALIMQLGSLLEELSAGRARRGIERLVDLTPRTARVLRDGNEDVVAAERVCVGEVLRVLPGEAIAVDGVVISGSTSVDQAVMTGESLPVDKGPGDEVCSGTVNQFGTFEMRATRVGEDSSIQRMVSLVRSADAGRAKIVRLADRWATWIVVGALSAAALCWVLTRDPIRSVTVLVVFCPCALVLATPTAVMAAIGNATRHGFLVKEGDALERLERVTDVAFDKTGTLTLGSLRLIDVVPSGGMDTAALLSLAASAELRSEHPLGRAIAAAAEGLVAQPDDFTMLPGRGVSATVGPRCVVVGSEALLGSEGVALPPEARRRAAAQIARGRTVVHCAADGRYVGLLSLADELRPEARATVLAIANEGVDPVLLTGDSNEAARAVAESVGIRRVEARCLPEDKLAYVGGDEADGQLVCMVGDGVNDAPALRRACVGIAMGGIGSDIAVDAADIVLVDDAISELPHLIALSRHMMRTIRANLTFSMLLNFIAVGLAIAGVLGPVVGALVHNAGSVFVIVNSSLLLSWRALRPVCRGANPSLKRT